LFREGDAGSVMYVIHAGRVRISRAFEVGERTLAVLGAGDFFGEMAILNGRPRAATATAVDALQVIELDANTLEAMVLGDPEIAVRLISRLARRVDAANDLIDLLLHADPRVRVILALARVAEEFGQRRDDGVAVPATALELAHTAGVAEPDAAAVLQRLARVRMLAPLEDGSYLVPEVSRIHEFVTHLGVARDASPKALRPHGAEAPRGGR
jgi:CRP/FNR family cyclic AMP-dependent transcriptional regulator